MGIAIQPVVGDAYEFEVSAGFTSPRVSEEILSGLTYPVLPFIGEVNVVVDAGANCGAMTAYIAQEYPDATVHAVEPASEPLAQLRRNVRGLPNVVVHPVGLHSQDQEVQLHHGRGDSGLGSIFKAPWHRDSSETVTIRAADAWAHEQGIERIDLLKVDVELCEYEVLKSLEAYLPSVKVVYLEYGSRLIRRSIEKLLDPTHDLYLGEMSIDQGECVYLRRDLADLDEAKKQLVKIFVDRQAAADSRAVARASGR